MEPPEKIHNKLPWQIWAFGELPEGVDDPGVEYHLPPEIFISEGTPNSIVGKWVAARGGVGGLHHIAIQVESVADKMKEWQDKNYAEFSSTEPMKCPGLTQVFTKPSKLCGVIFEFIEREEFGFCAANVKALMESTIEK